MFEVKAAMAFVKESLENFVLVPTRAHSVRILEALFKSLAALVASLSHINEVVTQEPTKKMY